MNKVRRALLVNVLNGIVTLRLLRRQEEEFGPLGQRVTQRKDFSIEVDMDEYVRGVERIMVPM